MPSRRSDTARPPAQRFPAAPRATRRALLAAGLLLPAGLARAQAAPSKRAILATYGDMAQAMYADALAAARALQAAVARLVAAPSAATLEAARQAWIAARVPYQQTECYRFGNPVVDEWEGRVNAWPLDEGLIDYVAGDTYGDSNDENPLYTANIIASRRITHAGETIDVATITPEVLAALHEIGGVEANVAIGWHAIEFLLWGQDLNGTGPGAGRRPHTDYVVGPDNTGGNPERRAAYLTTVTAMLVAELEAMVADWAPDGAARRAVTAQGPDAGLAAILTGLGSLSYGELAGERMKLGLLLHDPEEEHDCFSDNTHNSHLNNVVGMRAVYLGEYRRTDGTTLRGPAMTGFVRAALPALDLEMRTRLDATLAAFQAIRTRAETVEAYDQMLGEGNAAGNALLQAGIDALLAQTRTIERIAGGLRLRTSFEGSDSLDNPAAVRRP
ncbi:imelysin family protein [Falsiroseomonas selenitidurans]|uniref:Peptidase n=1 Tax=Falsiroseomonas selenitidurans TaxID=2716335 RepID=A0ABX1E246_9PROT|nr:imelysin family protein [Falsiroseomonas selenitidurans]NKC31229.1 peptidase [Falsiroseomonas selenitidurans]